MTAGTQPPDGVIDTTQPSSSAASIEVVPELNVALKASICASPSGWGIGLSCWPLMGALTGAPVTVHWASRPAKGLVPPWKGNGSPGLMPASFLSQSIEP